MSKQRDLRKIPKVDIVLQEPDVQELCSMYGKGMVLEGIRQGLDRFRREILSGAELRETSETALFDAAAQAIIPCWKPFVLEAVKELARPPLGRVFNGTGVILHTNLGRAPLGKRQAEAALLAMSGYANLEYNLKTGCRGKRQEHYAKGICRVTGSEGAAAVNNNAASMTLILSALAKGKEVIVSRGELIEIGGRFRIPEVMEQSGAVLREVGCTNRTRIADYEKAVNENTGALLKVHTSNYRIVGFTEEASVEELAKLGKRYGLPVIVDLGSGVLVNLEKYGLTHEPTVQEVLKAGADLVCFSGDKLLGGPQAGIIAGKENYIKEMEEHPLMRAFRLDKCTIAALAATFAQYLDEERAVKEIPVLRMLTRPEEELFAQAQHLCQTLQSCGCQARFLVERSVSATGGGALPGEEIPSFAVTIDPKDRSCGKLQEELRSLTDPVIGYVKNEKFWLDMRTILEEEAEELEKQLCSFFGGCL